MKVNSDPPKKIVKETVTDFGEFTNTALACSTSNLVGKSAPHTLLGLRSYMRLLKNLNERMRHDRRV
jgi:hypothetical protein